jgi:hypothetical protein
LTGSLRSVAAPEVPGPDSSPNKARANNVEPDVADPRGLTAPVVAEVDAMLCIGQGQRGERADRAIRSLDDEFEKSPGLIQIKVARRPIQSRCQHFESCS